MACIKTKKYVVELFNNLVNIFPQTGGGLEKCLQESHFSWYLLQIWNINSWDMWLSTHYFSGFLQDWFHVFLYEIKKNSVWYNFYQGTSVSITFYIFEHYQLWMMDSKGQRVFFPKTPQLCVWHTEVRRCYHFKLVSHFQLWFPIWGVLVNRLNNITIHSHVYSSLISVNTHIDMQVNKLNISIFSVQVFKFIYLKKKDLIDY